MNMSSHHANLLWEKIPLKLENLPQSVQNYKSWACNFKKDKWKFSSKILIMFWEDIPVTSVYKV